MKLKILMICSIIAWPLISIHGAEKATVITETGKKHSVFFLRMHGDTIYLKVPKEDRTFFSISGHKSRFKSVRFSDGTMLDLTLSNYPSDNQSGEPSGAADADTAKAPLARPSELAQALAAARDSTFYADSTALSRPAAPIQPVPRSNSGSVKNTTASFTLEKSLEAAGPAKRSPHPGRGAGMGLTVLSLAAFAGGGALYFMSLDDRKSAGADKRFLDQSAVPGPVFNAKVKENKQLTREADAKSVLAAGLAGIGAAGICIGIVLLF
jgi:hypothetical protein